MSLPRFGVTRPVPVRLLMFSIIIAGIYAALTIRREFFPEVDPDMIRILMPYPGATPQEIEESLGHKVEDAIADIDEIDEIQTTLAEGFGSVLVKLKSGVDIEKGHDEIERAIDALTDLPEQAERIQVIDFEAQLPAIMLTLYGDADESVMKQSIRQIADDLKTLPGMGEVILSGVRDYEISVEVTKSALLQHGISLPQISDAIQTWMADIPGGASRTSVGNINVRTIGIAEGAPAIGGIIVRSNPSGQAIRVHDIAEVKEGFVDEQLERRFNGRPSVSLTVFKKGDQDAVDIAQMVRAYAAGRRHEAIELSLKERIIGSVRPVAWKLGDQHQQLPGEIAIHSDLARFIEGRLDLLTENGVQGAILIFISILIMLNARTAWWVVTGLLTAIAGTLLLMLLFDVSLNLLTMFGLLITLGMLEDDAIVVSENITAVHARGSTPLVAAIQGAEQVFWPVIGTVLTTIVAFLPLMFVTGRMGDLMGALPMVVLFSLVVSVIETMTILPSHMAHSLERRTKRVPGRFSLFFRKVGTWRDDVVLAKFLDWYARFLTLTLEYRYITTCAALTVLIASVGMVAGGRLDFTFLPDSDAETIVVDLRMPIGSPLAQTADAVAQIEKAAKAQSEVRSISSIVGQQVNVDMGLVDASASHVGQIFIELTPVEARTRESAVVIDTIRRELADLQNIETLRFSELGGAGGGADITIRVIGENTELVVAAVKDKLAEFDGVHGITDDNLDSQRELQIELLPGAAAFGFNVADVARQVRAALYGEEPHVFSAKREDIDVRVRLSEASRNNLTSIENMWMFNRAGNAVPLGEIAKLVDGQGYSAIHRVNRKRAISITADTAPGTNPESVVAALQPTLDALQATHPSIVIELAGRQRDLADAFGSLPVAFAAALALVYVILASLFSSYIQPLVVMLAIPFAIIGVVWGHLLLGYQLTFLSLIGFVALTGVVVNNSLILIDFYNLKRAAGMPMHEALVASGRDRLRAIVLTTVTTFFGLAPLVFEQSFQAKFLIPMAISISFGLISSTVVVLTALPCFIVIVDDLKDALHYLWFGTRRGAENQNATAGLIETE